MHSYGMVSSDANMQLALKASAAAAQQVPGSYLVYEFSTSEDHTNWQPVVFKQGMSEAGPGFGLLRGLYDHRLQGKLVAAGSGDLAENMWLLNLADKLLEVGCASKEPLSFSHYVLLRPHLCNQMCKCVSNRCYG